jgi:ABC-2 type transport system ATP-binding protein
MGATDSVIQVTDLQKTYFVNEREAGMRAALRSLYKRKMQAVKAVDKISFEIGAGEIVGFLGPNGAGKTTTLKMLSGLLYPTGGEGRVLGYEPFKRDKAFLSQITLVMGQRNQLVWDIPAGDSYELNRAIYRIPQDEFKATLAELVELLDLAPLIGKPVRNLSLGERMKCEIAGALLHKPKILFLDEPTIGLDVTAQRRIREFLKEYNTRHGAAVMLTSHYMADVEALCKRVIVIHHGKLIFDGELAQLAARFHTHKTIIVRPGNEPVTADQLAPYGEILESEGTEIHLRVPREDAARVTAKILGELPITDVSIADPPIEYAIERIFETPDEAAPQAVAKA